VGIDIADDAIDGRNVLFYHIHGAGKSLGRGRRAAHQRGGKRQGDGFSMDDGFALTCYVWMYRAFIVGACIWYLFDHPPETTLLGIVLGLPIVGFFGFLAASALFLVLMVPLTLVEVIWESRKIR
jgi:hypothetical protein